MDDTPTRILVIREFPDSDEVELVLVYSQKIMHSIRAQFASNQSQQLLSSVHALLKKDQATLKDIQGIALIQGAHRFTISRLCGVIANTLSWSLHIPVQTYEQMPDVIQLEQDSARMRTSSKLTPVTITYAGEPTMTI